MSQVEHERVFVSVLSQTLHAGRAFEGSTPEFM
jgi:hypothetical protein